MEDIKTPLLDKINFPKDLRKLPKNKLEDLAVELRNETINVVSVTGGHLGASLGVIELTVAIHYVFNTPKDRLVWDVGHQAYPHKILTGRRDKIRTLRQKNGLYGFTKRTESEFDPFGAAHASTAMSSGLGMAIARDLMKKKNNVICVVGDGAMSGGMAYEAMNNAGSEKSRLIVILNDNDMSIAPPVGALSNYLSRLISSGFYQSFKNLGGKIVSKTFPDRIGKAAKKAEELARGFVTGGTLFEELGFFYIGPVDGHNLKSLIPILENAKKYKNGPILIHCVTKKGKGYDPAEKSDDKYHGVAKFNVATGVQQKSESKAPSYTKVYANSLISEAKKDKKIVAITAAMPDGTGIDLFQKEFPSRSFDVGIAEQHAVTFAAGLATEGFKPFATIYSTFLQRAYDQVVHDVAIQKLPVRFAMDRAGQVGADGPTHAGSFDIAYLGCLPGFVLMAPADESELVHMVATATQINDRPCVFRYPRGDGIGVPIPAEGIPLEIGKGRIVKEGNKIAILSYGARLYECIKAADILNAKGLSTTVADARFCKPLDTKLIKQLALEHETLITVEEGSIGGFASHVTKFLTNETLLDGGLKFRSLFFPDIFLPHGKPEEQYEEANLLSKDIAYCALQTLGSNYTKKEIDLV